MAHRNQLAPFISIESLPCNFYGDPRILDPGLWRAYGRQVPACPTVPKVHVTAEPLTHKFAPGFKWSTETNSRRLYPSEARCATFMATLGFWTLACGRACGRSHDTWQRSGRLSQSFRTPQK